MLVHPAFTPPFRRNRPMTHDAEGAVALLTDALDRNTELARVATIARRAFAVDAGPSGGPEALVYVDVEDLAVGCVYGHVRRIASGAFVSIMLTSARFVAAETPLLALRRFDYWMRERMDFVPVQRPPRPPQRPCSTFRGAVVRLAGMIGRHSPTHAWTEDGPAEGTEMDMDVFDAFPLEAILSEKFGKGRPPARLRSLGPPTPRGSGRG